FIPGCRFGPLAIRIFSEQISIPELNENSLKIADMGDVLQTLKVSVMLKRVKRIVEKIFSDGKKPIILGGENTLTLSSLEALSKFTKPAIVIFDSHLDLLDEYLDSRINHATWLRRYLEKKKGVVATIGYRDFTKEELEYGKDKIDLMISSEEILDNPRNAVEKMRDFVENVGSVYVSVDVDVLGAIGVSNPTLTGTTYKQIINILNILKHKIIGIDVVEVNPLLDHGLTAVYACYIIGHVLSRN
ncbi:MAG: arginase family protein, partial [Nitrososphaerota archaeon]